LFLKQNIGLYWFHNKKPGVLSFINKFQIITKGDLMSKTLEEVIAEVTKLSVAGFKRCPMSYDIYTQEAQDLNVWLQPDKETLIKRGCNPVFIEELPLRIEVLRDADAKLVQYEQTALSSWKACSAEGFKLVADMHSDFCQAFKTNKELLNQVKALHEKKGDADAKMVQNLREYGAMGKSYTDLLTAIGFEIDKCDYGITLSKNLEVKLAESNAEKKNSPHVVYCKQAYLHLKAAVDKIRDTGKFINKGNKERARGYTSEFLRQRAQKYRASKKANGKVPLKPAATATQA
jgi:hypothetical protein